MFPSDQIVEVPIDCDVKKALGEFESCGKGGKMVPKKRKSG